MKKGLFIIALTVICLNALAQSTTITPGNGIVGQYSNQKISLQTNNNYPGFEHTDGTIVMSTYITSTAGWLMTSTNHPLYFSTNSQLTPAMMIATNGNVGIGGITDPAEKLHVLGNARISGLGGSGVRFVRADNNGILSTAAITSYLNIPRGALSSVSGNTVADNFNGGLYCLGATVGYLEAPVNLPDGATITSMDVYYVDNSTKNVRVELHRRTYTSNTSTVLGTVTSAGASGNTNILSGSAPVNANNVVDNNTYVYYLRISALNAMNTAVTWDGTNLTINQFKITYTY